MVVFQFGSRQQAVTNVYDYVASVPDVFEGVNLDSCFIGRPRNLVTFSISRESSQSHAVLPVTRAHKRSNSVGGVFLFCYFACFFLFFF